MSDNLHGWHPCRAMKCEVCGETFETSTYNRAPLCDEHLAIHRAALLKARQQKRAQRKREALKAER